jgi:ketosteroid isomerase-like protein
MNPRDRWETTMASQATLPAANVELVRAGFAAFNVGDAEVCLALAARDLVINLDDLPERSHHVSPSGALRHALARAGAARATQVDDPGRECRRAAG